ncbi:MAG: TetR/AcrR family transcriptional regulator [Candidatus Ranarchaeia archaeon]
MNTYSLFIMRTRDQAKSDAIVKASIQLINKLGFDNISISKIAKKAKVSPATIYIYYKNKEDLFIKLYIEIRKKMHKDLVQGLTDEMTIEETFKLIWNNSITSNLKHPEYLTFREQFEQTTMMKKIKVEEFKAFQLVGALLQKGIDEQIFKDLPLPVLTAFAFIPIITLTRYHIGGLIKMDENQIKEACEIAWNTIKN